MCGAQRRTLPTHLHTIAWKESVCSHMPVLAPGPHRRQMKLQLQWAISEDTQTPAALANTFLLCSPVRGQLLGMWCVGSLALHHITT